MYTNKSEDNAKQKIDVDLQTIPTQYEDFEVVTFPGHAPDQVGFYLREQQILFGGDLLIEHISSNALVEPDQQGNRLLTLIEHKLTREILPVSATAKLQPVIPKSAVKNSPRNCSRANKASSSGLEDFV